MKIGFSTFKFSKKLYLNDEVHPEGKAVLITGCDSGFGHLAAKRFDAEGFRIFACCLFPSGEGALELQKTCSKKLKVLELNVTSDDSVKKVLKSVEESLGNDVLWALVNNAGMTSGFTVELSPMQAFQDCLEVNAIGPIRVTKAFLPLLRKSRGRVVNVTSLTGRQSFPFMSPYIISKHASAAFNDCLRTEMDMWGIRVISVEPDCFKTYLLSEERVDEEFETLMATLDDNLKSEYGQVYLQKFKAIKRQTYAAASPKIDLVVDSIHSAVTDEFPEITYSPRGSRFLMVVHYVFQKLCYSLQDMIVRTLMYVLGLRK
ncbi:hypothetical protein JTE90_011080 [Oedothorax gibbosus]|uniref:Estradiol 17-beta-dehydrogenase 2 n=1 Tax=Oedothorax gibbosus TaxID=931172 RepID=A0AAV6UMN7_9ARAC|nr:hypothetical protein JTE90_011080 [Oedothorax gibbosus]